MKKMLQSSIMRTASVQTVSVPMSVNGVLGGWRPLRESDWCDICGERKGGRATIILETAVPDQVCLAQYGAVAALPLFSSVHFIPH